MSLIKPVPFSKSLRLKDYSTDDTGPFKNKKDGLEALAKNLKKLDELQEKFFADDRRAILLVFQGMDTSGKGGAIERIVGAFDPQGTRIASFKAPTKDELSHDFLWRIHRELPAKGMIGVFDRSHYEDVLIVRVKNLVSEEVWRGRYAHIRNFERVAADGGTVILKFFLHISKAEQKRRLEARLEEPAKRWKFNPGDLVERKLWPKYQEAYEEALAQTSRKRAPWFVVPADHKWFRDLAISRVIIKTLEGLDLRFPPSPPGWGRSRSASPSSSAGRPWRGARRTRPWPDRLRRRRPTGPALPSAMSAGTPRARVAKPTGAPDA